MFSFLNHFNVCSQIEWISKKYIICSSFAIIKSFIACFDFDIFEWKVEKFNVFLKKQEQKKLKFSTSIPNFELDFHRIINPIIRKGRLSHILCLIAKSFTYCPNKSWFFLFFKLRQRMESHFKVKLHALSHFWDNWPNVSFFQTNIKTWVFDLVS